MVRLLTNEEIAPAMELVWEVFNVFEREEAGPVGESQMRSYIQAESVRQRCEIGTMKAWGYFEEDRLLGVLVRENANHIGMLFVKQEAQHRGIGRKLVETFEETCRVEGAEEVNLNATSYGHDFYVKLGYTDTDKTFTLGDAHYRFMRKEFD